MIFIKFDSNNEHLHDKLIESLYLIEICSRGSIFIHIENILIALLQNKR